MGRCHDGEVQTRPASCPTLETERLLLRPFRDEDLDVDRIFSCILVDNDASQAVAVRLGMELLEERTIDFFPAAPHGIGSRAR